MSFWSSQRLEQNLASILGTPDPSMVDCNAITLSVGSEIYITPDHTSPNTHTKQTLATNQAFSIPPGQFAFLVTEEIVSIPPAASAATGANLEKKKSGEQPKGR